MANTAMFFAGLIVGVGGMAAIGWWMLISEGGRE